MDNEALKLGLQVHLAKLKRQESSLAEQLAEVKRQITAFEAVIKAIPTPESLVSNDITFNDSAQTASKSIANQNGSLEEVSSNHNPLLSVSRSPKDMLREQYRGLSYVDATILYFKDYPKIGSRTIDELIDSLFDWQTDEELARVRASFAAEIRRRGVEEGRIEIDPQTKGKRPQRYRLPQQEASLEEGRQTSLVELNQNYNGDRVSYAQSPL